MTTTTPQTVSPQVRNLLPAVAIDYLWQLAGAEPDRDSHAFLLRKQPLGAQAVQEIHHIADGEGEQTLRVFGFTPVNAVIVVTESDGARRMETTSLLEALCCGTT